MVEYNPVESDNVTITIPPDKATLVMRALWLAADTDGIERTPEEEAFWSDLGDAIEGCFLEDVK